MVDPVSCGRLVDIIHGFETPGTDQGIAPNTTKHALYTTKITISSQLIARVESRIA